ncbi:hypothetical protein [Fusobacterium ulcerans]|uniref:Uncharacterized protein n=1 Tax=Fusobacterium ulcerans 12-1B TaxID=457404 RepID=H1PQM3_9FUSO|nr:hypothetical protein [Fusobacterium ulcerans]EHO83698.1 hypothetical protein HMPREF0402_00716 [Fusobacterium ulcerans 12-1B]
MNNERYVIVKDPITEKVYLIDKEAIKFNFINEPSTKKKRKRKGNFIEEYKNKVRKRRKF